MSFRITGLPAEQFSQWFALSDAELQQRHAVRVVADRKPGFPCRVSLTDAQPGDEVLLINYEHLAADSPYRARHAIYIRRGETTFDAIDEVPAMLRSRLLSVRAFDARHLLTAADVVDGTLLEPAIERMLADANTCFLHVHFAKPGCYAARVERA
jgi:hypothetical protein